MLRPQRTPPIGGKLRRMIQRCCVTMGLARAVENAHASKAHDRKGLEPIPGPLLLDRRDAWASPRIRPMPLLPATLRPLHAWKSPASRERCRAFNRSERIGNRDRQLRLLYPFQAASASAASAAARRPRALRDRTSVIRCTAPRSSSLSTAAISRAIRSSASS